MARKVAYLKKVTKMQADDATSFLKDAVPDYRWSVYVDLSSGGLVKWSDGIEDPLPALQQLRFLVLPPSVDPRDSDVGASVMCVAEDEVQVYVRCRNDHFLGVGAKRTENVGFVRSMAVRAAQKHGG